MKLARESEIRTHWRILAAVCTLTLAAPIPVVIRPFSLYIEPWRTESGVGLFRGAVLGAWRRPLQRRGAENAEKAQRKTAPDGAIRRRVAGFCSAFSAFGRGSP